MVFTFVQNPTKLDRAKFENWREKFLPFLFPCKCSLLIWTAKQRESAASFIIFFNLVNLL